MWMKLDGAIRIKIQSMMLTGCVSMGSLPESERTEDVLMMMMDPNIGGKELRILGIPEFIRTNYDFWLNAVETNPESLKYVPRVFMTQNMFIVACKRDPFVVIRFFPKQFITQKMALMMFCMWPIRKVLEFIPPRYITMEFLREIKIPGVTIVFHDNNNVRFNFAYGNNAYCKTETIKNTLMMFGLSMPTQGSGKNGRVVRKDLIRVLENGFPRQILDCLYPTTFYTKCAKTLHNNPMYDI